jgi:hypothetical protein
MVASINVGCPVAGSFGPFLPATCNQDGTHVKRQKCQQLEGVIVEAWGEKKGLVRFNNGLEKDRPCVGLKLLFDPRYRSGAVAVMQLPLVPSAAAAAAPPIAPQEPSSSAVVPPIASQEPSSSAAVQPNVSSSAEETPMAADDFNVDEMAEEILEGIQVEDVDFDVVENITSDVYQQKHQECEQKKLELIESSYNVTCKS